MIKINGISFYFFLSKNKDVKNVQELEEYIKKNDIIYFHTDQERLQNELSQYFTIEIEKGLSTIDDITCNTEGKNILFLTYFD